MCRVGVVGYGFVGLAVETGMEMVSEVRIYDKYKDTESLDCVVDKSEILFICVPTPMCEDGGCDSSIVEDVVEKIARIATEPKSIVIKSTVQPGTTEALAKLYPEHTFVFSPEYLTEKNFINDFLEQDRIVLGFVDKECEKVIQLMECFTDSQKNPAKIVITNSNIAEMAKYVANCFLATKVSFFNEIKEICDVLKIDFDETVDIVLLDKRIGKSHYKVPGSDGQRGFGGSCFPKDLNALIYLAEEIGLDPLILESVWSKNLLVREDYEWEDLSQVTGNYKKDD